MKFGRMPRYSPRKPSLATIFLIRPVMEVWTEASREAVDPDRFARESSCDSRLVKHAAVSFIPSFTLRLHPCAHQGQWVAGQLAAGTGDGPAAHQHHDPGIGRVFRMVRQPGTFQALRQGRKGQQDFYTFQFMTK